jgi:hypothetical protein
MNSILTVVAGRIVYNSGALSLVKGNNIGLRFCTLQAWADLQPRSN